MRAVVQRVTSARVEVAGQELAAIGAGLVVLLGVRRDDPPEAADQLAGKITGLRIFENDEGRIDRTVMETGGSVLCISQFTLFGDVRRGRRPSFEAAAPPAEAEPLYNRFCDAVAAAGVPCSRGRFGAEMAVSLTNDGPFTLLLDTEALSAPRRT